MKKILLLAAAAALMVTAVSCGNQGKKKAAESAVPEYTVVDAPEVDLDDFKVDDEGYIVLFDGTSTKGWRGEGQTGEGGDIIFAHEFKNFTFELEWKVSKGGNSGIFYLAKEVTTKDENGNERYEPIYISAPEYQVLDNANHPDALLGVDGNRQSASLYDMIPAVPQNQNPYGEWNKTKILVYKGTVVHFQNDVKVLEYHLWTQQWTDMLQASKFSEKDWPLAFELLNNCGGDGRLVRLRTQGESSCEEGHVHPDVLCAQPHHPGELSRHPEGNGRHGLHGRGSRQLQRQRRPPLR